MVAGSTPAPCIALKCGKLFGGLAISTELYHRYRPTKLTEVVGQPAAVNTITALLKNGKFPHVMLFVGPSGVGKTTICRILKEKLGCSDADYEEINCAADGSMEKMKDIRLAAKLTPWGGECRIFYLDEFQSLSRAGFSQQALLKILEDTPKHAYFFLAATDKTKIIPTIQTRCTLVNLLSIPAKDLEALVRRVAEAEGVKISDAVVKALVANSNGGARQALKDLEKVLGLPEDQREAALVEPEEDNKAFDLARAILWQRADWAAAATILRSLKAAGADPEGIRRMIIRCAANELLAVGDTVWEKKNGKKKQISPKAAAVLMYLRDPLFDSASAWDLLIAGVFEAVGGK